MTGPGWLTRSRADVPPGDGWLGPREREVAARLAFAPRAADWRLGRFTVKQAAGAWLGEDPAALEVLAAPDGAPEAWHGDSRAPVAISLSHRAGRALAVAGPPAAALGCDLELVERRSAAFLREWLGPAERELVAAAGPDAPLVANLLWAAKEAAAKVLREGLRLDVREAAVALSPGPPPAGGWAPLTVTLPGHEPIAGWWRPDAGSVLVVAGGAPERHDGPPRPL